MAELILSLMLISCVCAAGIAIICIECLDNVKASDAYLMNVGMCTQIWGFIFCAALYQMTQYEFFFAFMCMISLIGGGLFSLGTLSVSRVMAKGRVVFLTFAFCIEACALTFLGIAASKMMPYVSAS